MKLSAEVFRRMQWLQLPGALLVLLLQRTPVLRVAATAGDVVLRSPATALLKYVASALGAMGAVHSLAGATTLSASTPSPASAAVGTAKTIAFSVLGTQSVASSWTIAGSVPPGLTFNGGVTSGVVNTPTGFLTLSGTPTTAGGYTFTLKAWENSGGKGNSSPNFSYTVTVTGGAVATAPSITSQPTSQTVTAGATVNFTVAASGSPTPTYQWQKNGSALAGKTTTTLSLTNVQAADAASYTCVATNSAGSATSSAATLAVNAATVAPAFTTQPSSQSVAPGVTVTFTAAASGTPTPTYQWQKGGSSLSGQTTATLSLSNVQPADAGSYTCVATNTAGTVTSSAVTLTVSALAVAPAFTTQPSSQSVAPGVTVTFTAAASGTPTPTYQWQKGGSSLSGQTTATLSLSNVLAADAGSYTCVATNTAGTVTSSAATLTVSGVIPVFTTQPATQTATAGTSVTLTAAASGTPIPTYQWQKNGSAISGQTDASLSLASVQLADAASYACVATNATGSTTSSAAVLTVVALPVFTIQPASQAAQTSASVTLSVAVSGNAPTTYQWRKNGTPIAGQTGATLALSNLQAADGAAYSCVATNAAGSTTSLIANLTVSSAAVAPAFTTQPAAQTINTGFAATFNTVATGSPAPTFQWQKNGAILSGQTSATLTLASVQAGDAGTYVCVATNSAGTATSASAVLSVGSGATPPAFSLQPAAQTVSVGGTVSLLASATGTPAPSYQWSKNGVVLPGQNSATLTLANVNATAAGSYVCVATNAAGTATSSVAALTVSTSSAVTSMISNVSVRTTLDAGQTLFVGFTMQGGVKPVLVRAVGPGLGNFGVAGAMSDPRLAIYRGADMLTQNDNWGGSSGLTNAFASVGAFPLTPASMDAAVMRSLEGGHTAQITGVEAGNVLVEAYDAESGTATRLTNVSARNRVGTGADIMIAGFTIGGTGSKNLLVRAVGPTLADFGVPGTLEHPKLEIYNGAGERIAINEIWSATLSSAFSSVGAFPLTPGSADAALTISLPPGGYTVQVSGADGGTGEALVELYELP